MEFTEKQIDLFEKAASDNLKAEEQNVFDDMMKDEHLSKAYADFLSMQKIILLKGREKLKSDLKLIESEISKPNTKNFRRISITLGILGTLALTFLLYKKTRSEKVDHSKIYYAYYNDFPNSIDPLTKGDGDKLSAFQLYEQKRYSQAIDRFKSLDPSDTTKFFIALSHIGEENHSLSYPFLKEISSDQSSSFYLDANWYLALNLIKDNKFDEASILLNKLAISNSSYYKPKSKLLLKAVK